MDLSAPIAYNGVTLQPPSASPSGAVRRGVEIENIDISSVQVDAYYDPKALAVGVDASDVYERARLVSISAAVLGTTKGDVWDQAQSVLSAFNPSIAYNADTANLGFLAMTFRQPTIDTSTWSAGYIPMQMYLRPAAPPRFVVERGRTSDTAGRGFSLPVTLSLLARDPRKYAQTQQTISITTATQTATYRGDYPTWPILSFSMSASGSSSFALTVAGGTITLNLATTTTGTFTFNYQTRTLTDANGTVRADLISSVSSVRQVKSGSTVYASSTTGMSSVTLTYREAWA
jgi:hypothetical protein